MQVKPQTFTILVIFLLVFLSGITFELKQFLDRISAIESTSVDAHEMSKFNVTEVKELQEKIEELEAEIENLKN